MNRLAIVFWSGTGNTEQMAECIAQGAREAGAQVELLGPEAFSAGRLGEFDVVAFGCPAMGAEQLEEDSFEPMFSTLEDSLAGKKIALFGSFGWGNGEWMRTWSAHCREKKADLYDPDGLMANEIPNAEAREACQDLGRSLASW